MDLANAGKKLSRYAYIHTTNIHTYIHIYKYTHTYTHAYINTHIHTYIHTYIIHTYIHTHARTDLYCRHFVLSVAYYKHSDWGNVWQSCPVCLSFCGRMNHDELGCGRNGLCPVLGYCSSIWWGGWVQPRNPQWSWRSPLSSIKSGTYRISSRCANHCMASR
jgi:hypothetical protein